MSPTSCDVSRSLGGLGDLAAALKYGQIDEETGTRDLWISGALLQRFQSLLNMTSKLFAKLQTYFKICKLINKKRGQFLGWKVYGMVVRQA